MNDGFFKKIFPLLALLSVLLFIGLVWKNYNRPYLKYQREFKALLVQKAAGSSRPVKFEFGYRQRWIGDLGIADRCETCHLGIDDARFKNAPEPFTAHPVMAEHSYERFGCTICHGGQGRATTVEDAHGPTENWFRALYSDVFMQNSCAMCHGEFIDKQAPVFADGRTMFYEYGCRGCHKVGGKPLTRVGPPLDQMAQRVRPDWLYRWLKDPRGYLPRAKMPNPEFSRQEAADVAAFLLQGPGPQGPVVSGNPAQGKTALLEAHCVTCHSIEGKGGTICPELSEVGSKDYPQYLFKVIKNPHVLWPRIEMPVFGFEDRAIWDMVAYMLQEYTNLDLTKEEIAGETRLVETANKDRGRELIVKQGCTGCHSKIKGVKQVGELGPDLSAIGVVHISVLDFGDVSVPLKDRTVPNWLYNKVLNPRLFKKGLKMPVYHFNDRQAIAVTTYLLSLKGGQYPPAAHVVPLGLRPPASYVLPIGKQPSHYAPQGAFGKILDKYRCLVCHTIDGKGGDIAPDLSQEGSRVKGAWFKNYMKIIGTIRPMLPVRMTLFNFRDSEIDDLWAYCRTTLVTDKVEDLTAAVNKMPLSDPKLIQEGEKLYYKKFACNACHQINGAGGLIGPDLTQAGGRLTPEWVVYYLHDPKAFVMKNRSVEPVYTLTDSEIQALTAFVIGPKSPSSSGH